MKKFSSLKRPSNVSKARSPRFRAYQEFMSAEGPIGHALKVAQYAEENSKKGAMPSSFSARPISIKLGSRRLKGNTELLR